MVLEHDRNRAAALDAAGPEQLRRLIGTFVELAERDRLAGPPHDHSGPVGRPLGNCSKMHLVPP